MKVNGIKVHFKKADKAGHWWLLPVILATQEDCSSKPPQVNGS
jgi:hypothetical protein